MLRLALFGVGRVRLMVGWESRWFKRLWYTTLWMDGRIGDGVIGGEDDVVRAITDEII